MDEKLERAAGSSEKLITFVKDRAGHDLRYAIDSSRIRDELNLKPSLNFEQGLSRTVTWYLENREWMDHVTSGAYQAYYKSQYEGR
jgi:dTDP-glucose 4,6-dehydratase